MCAAVLASVLVGTLLASRRQQFQVPGIEASLCSQVGHWAMAHNFTSIGFQMLQVAENAHNKRLNSAVRSGRLAVVTFHDQGGLGMTEFSQYAFQLGLSNGWQVVMVRLKIPSSRPETFEVLLDPKGKQQMEKLVRTLEEEKAHSRFE